MTRAAVVLSGVLFLLSVFVAEPSDGLMFLMVVPVTMVAAEHGVRAGMAMASAAAAMLIAVDWARAGYSLQPLAYVSRVGLYLLTALIVGKIYERLRAANEIAVAESRDRLATYFDNAPSLLFWMDLEGRFVEVNKASEQLLGQPREKLVGNMAGDFFSPEIRRSIQETNKQVLTDRETIRAEDQIETPEGTQHFQTIKFPLWRNGQIYGIGGISYNVTDLVKARRALERARRETIVRLARAVEYRDEATVDHVERMSAFCELIARRLGLDEKRCQYIRMASAMHDAGKIAVPDSILLKPGPLSEEERKIMQSHAEVGWELLRGSDSDVLELAALIAYTHHERYDGTGYPRGLAGSEIPIEGRIAAVADVFDALTSDRIYRRALPLEEALETMQAERGLHFDPDVLDAFLGDVEIVRAIENRTDRLGALADLPPELI